MGIKKGDFSKGSVPMHMISIAAPIFLAELVNVTYNIVDRMFIGHIPSSGTLALSGVGVAFPLISFINAFAGFVSSGGAPLFSITRGEVTIRRLVISWRRQCPSFFLRPSC